MATNKLKCFGVDYGTLIMYNYDMGVELYISNTFRGAFDGLTAAIERNGRDKPSVVIVPDRFSLTIEKAILDKLGIAGTMSIRVMSFSRLAALTLGDKAHKCLSAESSAMLMNKVVRSLKDKLRCYGRVRDLTSLSKDLYAAISSLRNSGITVNALKDKLIDIKNQGIRNKTDDIILVYEGYIRELNDRYNDNTTRLEAFAAEIATDKKLKDSYIYITDFYSFKSSEYKIIRELMKYAKSVGISLIESPRGALNGRIYPYVPIREIAGELDIEVKERYSPLRLSDENALIERYLFSYRAPQKIIPSNMVRLLRASSIENELVAVAQMIREEVVAGARYRDIALLSGNLDVYAPYVKNVFKRFNIPYFIDRGVNMAEHPLVLFIESLYDYINNETINSAFAAAKNFFSGININDAYALENYCIKYGIKGRALLNYRIDDEEAKRARDIFAELVQMLIRRGNASVGVFIQSVKELLLKIDAPERLQTLMDKQTDLTDDAGAEVTRQIYGKLNEILDGMSEILGNETMNMEEFSGMLIAAATGTEISMIPQYIDSVFVGEPEESRYARIKTLFVVGSDERVMPPPRKDQGIIGEKECNEWGIEIYPSRKFAQNIDKLALMQLLIKPEKALIVSYSMRSEAGEYLNCSSVIKQLKSIFDKEIELSESVYGDDYSAPDEGRANLYAARFATRDNGCRELSDGMRRMRLGGMSASEIKPYDALYSFMDEDRKSKIAKIDSFGNTEKSEIGEGDLLGKSGGTTSISRLESYFACPFMHYVKYGIGAEAREEAGIEANIRGTFIHSALEEAVKTIMSIPEKFDLPDKELFEIKRNVIEALMAATDYNGKITDSDRPLLQAGAERAIDYAVFAIRKSRFKPFLIEERIGGNNIKSPILQFNESDSVSLIGKIDRVDKLGNKVIVIDYKTGQVHDLATELYYGRKIQLFIYLSALKEAGYYPAGALYMKLKDEFKKEDNSGYLYEGIISENIRDDFDLDKEALLTDEKIGVSEEFIDSLMEYSRKIVSKAASEIYSGYYESKPLPKVCGYCAYEDICLSRLKERQFRKESKVGVKENPFCGGKNAEID